MSRVTRISRVECRHGEFLSVRQGLEGLALVLGCEAILNVFRDHVSLPRDPMRHLAHLKREVWMKPSMPRMSGQ